MHSKVLSATERGDDDDVMMTCETLNPFMMRFARSTNRPFRKTSRISECGLQPRLPSYLFTKPVPDSIDADKLKRQDFLGATKQPITRTLSSHQPLPAPHALQTQLAHG